MKDLILNEFNQKSQAQSDLENTLERALELEERFAKENLPEGYFINDKGLHYLPSKDGAESVWISAAIYVIAISRNPNNECFGKVVEFDDPDFQKHEYTIPMELLAGDSKELRGILMSQGLDISPDSKARGYFLRYIQLSKPCARVRSIQLTGWNGVNCFVLPHSIIGMSEAEKIIF